MRPAIQLRVIDEDRRTVFVRDYSGRVEVGRQDKGEPGPYGDLPLPDGRRLVIAPLREESVSRHQLTIEPVSSDRLRVRNISTSIPVRLGAADSLPPGESRDLPIPSQVMIGRTMIWVGAAGSDPDERLDALPEATIPPGRAFDGLATRGLAPLTLREVDPAGMIRTLRAAMDVLQAAATSSDFLDKAARAAAELVGLDSASVWRLQGDEWRPAGNHTIPRAPASGQVLDKMRRDAKTIFNKPEGLAGATVSLESLSAVVAAPILDRDGRVIGALYGDRSFASPIHRQRGEITQVEAMLVELLASGIAAGLERLRHEQDAVAARVRFEQFFTHDLAEQLERNPDLLKGRESEVTVLFGDIRGFSRISEKLGPAKTVEWINDVMGVLSDSVLDHQGVLVDYIGDELMAMWGAPIEEPEHAALACRAALDMLERLPELVDRWEPVLGEAFDLGIGINSGLARVGNTGSIRKFKYGPLGNTVNLASRVQGVTKHFKARLVITGQTRAAIGDSFACRRLGKVRVVNIAEPVELYELVPDDHPNWDEIRDDYEKALGHFESGPEELRPAAGLLGNIQVKHPNDGPSLILLARVVNGLCDQKAWDPVWTLESK